MLRVFIFIFFVLDLPVYRFTIYKVNKASKKKREKSSAKKERKATKTLAIVLGKLIVFLFKRIYLLNSLTFVTQHLSSTVHLEQSSTASNTMTVLITTISHFFAIHPSNGKQRKEAWKTEPEKSRMSRCCVTATTKFMRFLFIDSSVLWLCLLKTTNSGGWVKDEIKQQRNGIENEKKITTQTHFFHITCPCHHHHSTTVAIIDRFELHQFTCRSRNLPAKLWK